MPWWRRSRRNPSAKGGCLAGRVFWRAHSGFHIMFSRLEAGENGSLDRHWLGTLVHMATKGRRAPQPPGGDTRRSEEAAIGAARNFSDAGNLVLKTWAVATIGHGIPRVGNN